MLQLRFQYDRNGNRIQDVAELIPTAEYQQLINELCAASIAQQARDNAHTGQAAEKRLRWADKLESKGS